MILKHFNQNYSDGLPLGVGDRYYAQDVARDFWYGLDKIGSLLKDLTGAVKNILSGGAVTVSGTTDCIDISACVAYAAYSVIIPNSFSALPPSSMAADVDALRIVMPSQVAFNLITSGATGNGSTPNYIKLAYSETDGNTRTRIKSAGSYPYEKVPSFTITCDSAAPTSYEVCLGSLLWNSGTHVITLDLVTYRDAEISPLVQQSPSGTITAYGGSVAPAGWLLCDGASYLKQSYPKLYSAISTAFGTADSTHFNVPDLRGRFLRGQDAGAGNDPDAAARVALNAGGNAGDAVGSYEADAFASHSHSIPIIDGINDTANGIAGGLNKPPAGTGGTYGAGGNETRPKNVNVNYIIKI